MPKHSSFDEMDDNRPRGLSPIRRPARSGIMAFVRGLLIVLGVLFLLLAAAVVGLFVVDFVKAIFDGT